MICVEAYKPFLWAGYSPEEAQRHTSTLREIEDDHLRSTHDHAYRATVNDAYEAVHKEALAKQGE